MNKYVPYIIITLLIIGTLIFVSGKFNTKSNIGNTPQTDGTVMEKEKMTEKEMTNISPSLIPVSQIELKDKSSVQKAIDAELNQLDRELSEINDSNLDANGLSDEQLGL